MTGQVPLDPETLLAVELELARTDLRLRFRDRAVEGAYRAERRFQSRLHNRVIVALLVLIFDLFILGEVRTIPEVLVLSVVLRFVLLTPLSLLFIVLDWRGALGRWTDLAVVALLVAPTLLGGVETLAMSNSAWLQNWQAVALIPLAVLTCRVSLLQAATAVGLSCLTYAVVTVSAVAIPAPAAPSLLLTDVAVAIAVMVFTMRLDLRDRQVFLFNRQAEMRGDALAAQNRKLARLTQVDALTGLGNRRRFDEMLAAIWADDRARNADVALIMLDIDCFKLFNDSLGHQAGDECLVTLGHALTRCLRDDGDTLVRYGGEEFAVVLPATSLAEGWSVAERMRQAALDRAIPHRQGGPAGVVTVSLGVAAAKPGESSPAALIEMADRCLYAAKRGGRNRTVTEEMMRETAPFPADLSLDDASHDPVAARLR